MDMSNSFPNKNHDDVCRHDSTVHYIFYDDVHRHDSSKLVLTIYLAAPCNIILLTSVYNVAPRTNESCCHIFRADRLGKLSQLETEPEPLRTCKTSV